jgi:hypothetical protein
MVFLYDRETRIIAKLSKLLCESNDQTWNTLEKQLSPNDEDAMNIYKISVITMNTQILPQHAVCGAAPLN